ncbi:GroES-like protein [Rhypophila decipiens]|uniref:GroES-like protein n=1 Tax=Rhypophila decipiens TaxID=261697 RepID=A0AAN6YDZ2_9PEZI|nr:GroES-like protein [Rhypophila decipiens]
MSSPQKETPTALSGKEFNTYRSSNNKLTTIPSTIPSTLLPHQILIRITHSGVCYTDYEYFKYGSPAALGHEGVGLVEAVGSSVRSVSIGDRVGTGFLRDSCMDCRYCLTGKDIWCLDRAVFGLGDIEQGSFSGYYIGKEGYVFKIPEGLASADAAPLQCAGATVYSALADNVRPGDRVGILGVGGLGHLAIQFAEKMGNQVVVFSTSRDKETEARGFGASEFVLLGELEKLSKPVDVLIIAGAKYPDWEKVLVKEIVARLGTIIPLPAPTMGPYVLPASQIFWEGYKLHSSLTASRAQHVEMLEFAARHNIKPAVQLYEFKGPETVEDIFEKLGKNQVRYRAVLVMP